MDRVACRACAGFVAAVVTAAWLIGVSGALASGWSVQPVATPPGMAGWELKSVSCASPRDCLADGIATGPVGVVGHWNGANWSIDQASHMLAGPGSRALTPWVSCISGRGCVVVGSHVPRGIGVRWSIPSFPTGIDLPYASSSSLSCASPTACTAIGETPAPLGQSIIPKAVVERWNGRRWAIQSTPKVRGNAVFATVSCPSVTACVLVGYYKDREGDLTLTERWNGTKWLLQRSPTPVTDCQSYAGLCGVLTDVSCASPVACIAIGQAGPIDSLVERWNGKTWSIQRTGNIGRPSQLFGVSCGSATACTAVGGDNAGQLAERWNGKRWTVQHTPSLPGSVLTGVSCPTPTDCTAVGGQGEGPLGERWTGLG